MLCSIITKNKSAHKKYGRDAASGIPHINKSGGARPAAEPYYAGGAAAVTEEMQ